MSTGRNDKVKVWLDDTRDLRLHLERVLGRSLDPTEWEAWVWIKTAPEAIGLIETGRVDEISLDHDLGDEELVGSGYDVITWIEEKVATDESYEPPVIHVHSGNVVGWERLDQARKAIDGMMAARRRRD